MKISKKKPPKTKDDQDDPETHAQRAFIRKYKDDGKRLLESYAARYVNRNRLDAVISKIGRPEPPIPNSWLRSVKELMVQDAWDDYCASACPHPTDAKTRKMADEWVYGWVNRQGLTSRHS